MITATAVRLAPKEWERIIQLGADRHIEEVNSELDRAREKILEFETKYKMSFTRLEQVGLPDDAGLEEHEDYVEWSGWEGYAVELKEKLDNLQALVANSNGG